MKDLNRNFITSNSLFIMMLPKAHLTSHPRKFVLGEENVAGQRLIEFRQENALVIANTRSNNTKRLYTWTSPDGQH